MYPSIKNCLNNSMDNSVLYGSEDGSLVLLALIAKMYFFFRLKGEEKIGTPPHPPTRSSG